MRVRSTAATTRIAAFHFLFLAVVANADTRDAEAVSLTRKYGCQSCHAVEKKILGPSYKDVAARYAGDATALEKLRLKVRKGGNGVWGAIPMPGTSSATDADIAELVDWILLTK